MRNQSWLPDGTLVNDDELWDDGGTLMHTDHLTGETRLATADEIATMPDPDEARAQELLATSPNIITQPEIWELLRIIGRRLGLSAEVINDNPYDTPRNEQPHA